MESDQITALREFSRLHTQRVGALHSDYLDRGRPLGEARLIYEIGTNGSEVKVLREKLALDSGYASRLLRSLERQKLVRLGPADRDRRRRFVRLTPKGVREREAYDRLSDRLAQALLQRLDDGERRRLVAALNDAAHLIRKASVELHQEDPQGEAARWCLGEYYRELDLRFENGFDPGAKAYAGEGGAYPLRAHFIVARMDSAAVGCGSLVWSGLETCEIKRMWVAPHARGLGIARRLLSHLENVARTHGLQQVRLDTNRTLKEAHALYRSAGYVEIARYSDNPYAHFWFGKKL